MIFGVNMSKLFIIVLPILGVAFGHDTYAGTCPKFQGMVGFNWNRVYIIFIVKLPSEIFGGMILGYFLYLIDISNPFHIVQERNLVCS